MCACLDVHADIIEPCGFVFSDKHLRRSGMDYLDMAKITRHVSWDVFVQQRQQVEGRRVVLLTTKSDKLYTGYRFHPDDVLLLGSESTGAPEHVHEQVDGRVTIPMAGDARSLNIAVAAAMVVGEALRQTREV